MDPERVAIIATALADRFAELDPEHASHFYQHAAEFVESVERRIPGWRAKADGASGAVLFHQDANYLFYFLGVPVHGFLEPVPGIPPTASHIKALTDSLQGKRGVVIHTTFQPEQAPEALGRALDWPVRRLSLEPPLGSTGVDYLAHIDRWIDAIVTGQ